MAFFIRGFFQQTVEGIPLERVTEYAANPSLRPFLPRSIADNREAAPSQAQLYDLQATVAKIRHLICPHRSSEPLPTAEVFAAECRQFVVDTNLCKFFPRVVKAMPEHVAPLHLTGTLAERAKTIRNWMSTHGPLLNTVTELDLSDCGLTMLPPEIGMLKKLRELGLHNSPAAEKSIWGPNKLARLPAELFTLKELRKLSLHHNNFITISGQIAQLTSLEVLDLSHNKLRTIPAEMGLLPALERLDLSHNALDDIPCHAANPPAARPFRALKALSLQNNNFTALPANIDNLAELQKLDCSHNKITTLPVRFTQLPQLADLDLSHNALTSLPREDSQWPALKRLRLGHNRLESVEAIGNLPELEEIDLQNNQLSLLPAETTYFRTLLRLNLSQNKLERLPGQIQDMRRVEELYIDDNQIMVLDPAIERLEKLSTLSITGNLFSEEPSFLDVLRRRSVKVACTIKTKKDIDDIVLCKIYPRFIEALRPGKFISPDFPENSSPQEKAALIRTRMGKETAAFDRIAHLDLSNLSLMVVPPEVTLLKNLSSVTLHSNAITQCHPSVVALRISGIQCLFARQISVEQENQNKALRKIFPKILTAVGASFSVIGYHRSDRAAEMRTWMHRNTFRLNGVKELDLSDLNLPTMPPEIMNLKQLKRVIFSADQLGSGLHDAAISALRYRGVVCTTTSS